jgi:hypothetical protein
MQEEEGKEILVVTHPPTGNAVCDKEGNDAEDGTEIVT